MSTTTTPSQILVDITRGKSWEYDTIAQLRTATRLYAIQHPHSTLRVTLNGVTFTVREA